MFGLGEYLIIGFFAAVIALGVGISLAAEHRGLDPDDPADLASFGGLLVVAALMAGLAWPVTFMVAAVALVLRTVAKQASR